jgi:hypothetical protein
MISLRLTPYEMELLRSEAAAQNTSLSATLRRAVMSSARENQVGYTQGTYTFNAATSTTHFVDNGKTSIALPNNPSQLFMNPITKHS